MAKSRNKEQILAGLEALAERLAWDDESSTSTELEQGLLDSGIDPDDVRKKFASLAAEVARRERTEGRAAPEGLRRAIEQIDPAMMSPKSGATLRTKLDRWLSRFGRAFELPADLESIRAYRNASDLSDQERSELDRLEEQLRQRLMGRNNGKQ